MMDAMKVAAVLRRAAENAGCGLHEVVTCGGDCPEGSCNGCREASAAWANEAADAIERCALPGGVEWPSVGGRKVDFKTAYEPGLGVLEAVCIYSNGACEVMSHDGIRKPVSEIRPAVLAADGEPLEVGDRVWWTWGGQEYVVEQVRSSEEVYVTLANGEFSGQSANPRDLTHQRPVLDADGAEIRVGDTVYYVDGHEQKVNTVARLTDGLVQFGRINEAGYVTYCEGACISPDQLTHQRPVLDADGVPIKVGDTVYEADGSGHAFKVVGIRIGDGSLIGQTVVTCDVGDGTSEHFLPINLTHEPSDTWERIEEDARGLDSGVDRELFTHTHEDLVRRAKKLAGVDND